MLMFKCFCACLRFSIQRRISQPATAKLMRPRRAPMTIPAIPPPETCLCRSGALGVGAPEGQVVLDGLTPNGQKSPPLGGKTQVKESPSRIISKPVWTDNELVVFVSRIKGAGVGTISVSLQFGPRAPIKDVLPDNELSWTVKFWAEVRAIA